MDRGGKEGFERLTPAMRQYLQIKSEYPDCLLLFRIGDFYELFFEDAVIASRTLDIVLTSKDGSIPMAGFPHHAAESYISRLVKEGFKVAICEQLEDPSKAKGIVKRGVVRVITPGLVTELSFVSPDENNFIAVIRGRIVIWADITTGEVKAKIARDDFELSELIRKISPREILSDVNIFPEYKFTKIDFPNDSEVREILAENFDSITDVLKVPFASLIKYIRENIKDIEIRIEKPEIEDDSWAVQIDSRTLDNLDVFKTYEGKKGSLLWVLDSTKTPMGKRKLRNIISSPLADIEKIRERLDAVEEVISKKAYEEIDLEGIADMERLAIRLMRKIINPKELVSLKESAKKTMATKDKLSEFSSKLIRKLSDDIPDLWEFVDIVERYIVEPPPLKAQDGAIKKGISQELDRVREIKENSEKILIEYEERERARTGIPLKIGYNQVFGYYIEVSKVHLGKVPGYFKRKQTLANAERFTTEELERIAVEISSASEREKALNQEIYNQLIEDLQRFCVDLLQASRAIALLDVIFSFAQTAFKYDWVKPQITDEKVLYIKEGRHPSLELMLKDEKFIPNSVELDENDFMWIITGPNMAGKSVFLKQCALITLLAQVGSFVPAKEAKIGIADKIFFRTGASDDIARGRSTFFVEMEELSQILKSMTEKSLVFLDEVGRGTSTFDGISIAWATAEFINKRKVRCLFATHFHELSFLELNLKGIKNMHFSAERIGGNLVFVRKIKRGPAGKSWGIDVARLAGIPDEIIQKAEKILIALEQGKIGDVIKKISGIPLQISLFSASTYKSDPIRQELKKIDINSLTPVEALNILSELKKLAEQ
ncbi:DNA mismatch repair protein MutS [bacterium HR19]|nr:DNA mismatch repair protein MutS [bacterium HR19]